MSYEIQSLVMTRRDPNRKGIKPANTNSGVMLGQRKLQPGQSTLVGDAFYDRNKKSLDRYLELGMVSIKKLPDRMPVDESPELVVARIDIVDQLPEGVEVLATATLLEPVPTISEQTVEAETLESPATISAAPADTIPVAPKSSDSVLPPKRVVKRVGKNVTTE